MCTTITALVFGDICSSKEPGSIFRVSSISAILGVVPDSIIASAVATKVNAWVITSSPLPIFRAARLPGELPCRSNG